MSLQREILSPVTTNQKNNPKCLYISDVIYMIRESRDTFREKFKRQNCQR